MSAATHRLRLPARFYDDHAERDLPSGEEGRRDRRYVWVIMDDATLQEMESDASHYASANGPDAEWLGGLKASARATLKAIAAHRASLEPTQ